jgi:hypothetical protein
MQWKVFLALVGVVIVGATIGSVLRPTSKPQVALRIYAIRPIVAPRSIPEPVLKSLLKSLPTNAPISGGFLPAHETPLDRLRAWLDNHAWGGGWTGSSPGNDLITIANPGASKLCAQGYVRGRMYHVLGYRQSQFRFSNYVPSPVPAEFVPGPCPARRSGPAGG